MRSFCDRMIFCNGGINTGFEEVLNIEFGVWGDCGKKPQRKVEACVGVNFFKLGVRGGTNNVIFKSSLLLDIQNNLFSYRN